MGCFFGVQVRFRFRDVTLVEGLEQMGLEIEGMPDLQQPTADVINNENV